MAGEGRSTRAAVVARIVGFVMSFRAAAAALLSLGVLASLGGCGTQSHSVQRTDVSGPLKAFQLPVAGPRGDAQANSWEQYGGTPVNRALTLNAVTLYDGGPRALVLLGIRQVHPAPGLIFGSQQVTVTPGFAGFSEQIKATAPQDAFGLHANFSPLNGFLMDPNPKRAMSGVSPTVVLRVTATRPGTFHIGDWLITYRVGTRRHSLRLVDDGEFCAGAHGCPAL